MKQNINYVLHHKNATFKLLQSNLSPLHISMYNSLFYIWNESGFSDELNIVRSEIMQFSKIGSANTYTKVLKELHDLGFLIYKPSHNPLLCSKVTLIRCDNTTDNTTDKSSSKGTDNTTDNTRDTYMNKLLNKETIKLLNENATLVNDKLPLWISSEKGFDLSFVQEEFLEIVERWLKYKIERREKYKTLASTESMYKKLLKLSNSNIELAEKIIEEAIANNYSGFFALKQGNNNYQNSSETYIGNWEVHTINQNGKNVEILSNEDYLKKVEWCKNPDRFPRTEIEKAIKTDKRWI
jgi:hypothetical protein